MTDPLVATHVAKHYRNVTALENFDLSVPEGAIYGVAGPNGAGKSTLIKILTNILKPDEGRTEVLGVNSRALGPGEFARIGYVSENQETPNWMTTGYLLAYLKPFYPDWDDAYAEELIRQYDLPLDRKLKHLSRGMRMKAVLVSSLAYRPKILILDEPFSGLDPLVRDDLIQGMLSAAGETTILISSHDLAEVESFASHIAYLDRGRLQFAEEMTSLAARFREIEVVLEGPAEIPRGVAWPDAWLRPDAAASVVRFVDSRFDEQRTPEEIRRVFGGVRGINSNPMPLRSIFVTLARSLAKAA